MKPSEMLSQMCHQVLSNADIKAICKQRGFSAEEAGSRALFETFFLSEIGVEAAMQTLSPKEVAVLHLLKLGNKAVDVSRFERTYMDSQQPRFYGSFNRRYQAVFKQVKTNLVRKGLLLWAEAKDPNAKSKLARWRFRLPKAFFQFVPPLFVQPTHFDQLGDVRTEILRHKVLEFTGVEQATPLSEKKAQRFRVTLQASNLQIGDKPFQVQQLEAWQRSCWQAALPKPQRDRWAPDPETTVPVLDALTYMLNQLPDQTYVRPDQLAAPLTVFTDPDLDYDSVCLVGWYWGCLARQRQGETVYYRLAPPLAQPTEEVAMKQVLDTPPDQPTRVNLEKIPYVLLEQLAQIADFSLDAAGGAFPIVRPNLVKIGYTFNEVHGWPLARWLREKSTEFQTAFVTVEKRWGKQIVHQNLLVARVRDVGLKAQLEKTFSDSQQVLFLPNDYIAFPSDLRAKIERAVTKSGHVVKRVQADA